MLVITTIIAKFIFNFLRMATILKQTYQIADVVTVLCEVIFLIDVVILILHNYWPIVRLHMRIYRRSIYLLLFDILSLIPLIGTCKLIRKYEHFYSIYVVRLSYTDSSRYCYIIIIIINSFTRLTAKHWALFKQEIKPCCVVQCGLGCPTCFLRVENLSRRVFLYFHHDVFFHCKAH